MINNISKIFSVGFTVDRFALILKEQARMFKKQYASLTEYLFANNQLNRLFVKTTGSIVIVPIRRN